MKCLKRTNTHPPCTPLAPPQPLGGRCVRDGNRLEPGQCPHPNAKHCTVQPGSFTLQCIGDRGLGNANFEHEEHSCHFMNKNIEDDNVTNLSPSCLHGFCIQICLSDELATTPVCFQILSHVFNFHIQYPLWSIVWSTLTHFNPRKKTPSIFRIRRPV